MYNNNINQEQFNMQPPYKKQQSGFAIASMVLGIISLVISCCIPVITLVLAFTGFILGVVSLSNKMDGTGMAIAGIIMSYISLIISIICFLFTATIFLSM